MEGAWEIYFTEHDGAPAFVMADIGLASFPEKDAYSEVILCRIPIKELGENLLPTGAALDCIYEFEKAAESLAETNGTAIYAGRFGVGRTVTLVFYTKNGEALIKAFGDPEELGALASYECEKKHDPEWSQYFALLYPSPEIRNSLNNKRVLDALKNDGDDGLAEREIDHWAYFESEASAHSFAQSMIERDFSLVDQSLDDDDRWRVQISRDDRPSDIDEITWNLEQISKEFGGEYDGWECGVVRRHGCQAKPL